MREIDAWITGLEQLLRERGYKIVPMEASVDVFPNASYAEMRAYDFIVAAAPDVFKEK